MHPLVFLLGHLKYLADFWEKQTGKTMYKDRKQKEENTERMERVKFSSIAHSWSEVPALCGKPGGTLNLVLAHIEWI